jgi:hypothetical protein
MAATDHDRVITSGAWLGAIAGMSALGWSDTRIPHLAGFALNWTVVLAVCYAVACWKRAWYGWVAFWGMAAVCAAAGILQLAGLMTGESSTAVWCVAVAMVAIWYWLIRMPRLQPAVRAVTRHEIHVFHHVVQELPGWASAEVTGPARKVIAGSTIAAIEPTRLEPAPPVRQAIAGTHLRKAKRNDQRTG